MSGNYCRKPGISEAIHMEIYDKLDVNVDEIT